VVVRRSKTPGVRAHKKVFGLNEYIEDNDTLIKTIAYRMPTDPRHGRIGEVTLSTHGPIGHAEQNRRLDLGELIVVRIGPCVLHGYRHAKIATENRDRSAQTFADKKNHRRKGKKVRNA
jgi:hypothetical protein